MPKSAATRTRPNVQSRTTRDPDAPDAITPAKTGPSLSAAQRRALLILIGVHWDTETVLAIVREEHSDWPVVTAETVRYHRRQLEEQIRTARLPRTGEPTPAQQAAQETLAAIDAEQARALTMGLALSSVRVGQLTRLYQRLDRSLVDRQEKLVIDGKDVYIDVLNPQIAREMRGTLEQIAKEVGGYPNDAPVPGVNIFNAPGAQTLVVTGEAKARLADAMQAMQERREAIRMAEEGLPE